MGKKGSWLSAIKRVFSPNSKDKLVNGTEKKAVKEKKRWGLGRLRHGDTPSFIPLHREPSSIEKILGDAEREHQRTPSFLSREHQRTPATPTTREQQRTPSFPTAREHHKSPSMPPREHQQQTHSLASRAHHYKQIASPSYHQIAAIKIQTAYRGYMARRSFRALKGLVRLQGVVRGQSVKRQTMNAMRCMQLLVRVQSQIHTRRIQMMETQALQRQNLHRIDKDLESNLGKGTFTHLSETDQHDEWDDSLLTKEEMEARMQRKVEAVMKRERALAYAYSHQLWKGTPNSAHNALMEIRSGGFPWWWNWLERRLPSHAPEDPTTTTTTTAMYSSRNIAAVTPPPHRPSPDPDSQLKAHFKYKPAKFGFDGLDAATPTPRSAKSSSSPMMMKRAKQMQMQIPTPPASRTPQNNNHNNNNNHSPLAQLKLAKPRRSVDGYGNSLGAAMIRDDESLTSCPAFSVPNYMVPTVSAKAKVRAQSIMGGGKERTEGATGRGLKKRLSFPLTQSIGSLFSGKDSASQRISRNQASMQSLGNLSVDSTLSLPAGVGRKPFQRFV